MEKGLLNQRKYVMILTDNKALLQKAFITNNRKQHRKKTVAL